VLVVKSKVKAYAKKKKMSIGDEALKSLSNEVKACIDKAASRAKADGRVTIKDRDF
jgi:histone H3/H4